MPRPAGEDSFAKQFLTNLAQRLDLLNTAERRLANQFITRRVNGPALSGREVEHLKQLLSRGQLGG